MAANNALRLVSMSSGIVLGHFPYVSTNDQSNKLANRNHPHPSLPLAATMPAATMHKTVGVAIMINSVIPSRPHQTGAPLGPT